MEFRRVNNGDVTALTLWSNELQPGVLTHAAIICELPSIQYGDCLAQLYMVINDPSIQYPYVMLASGIISMMTPVFWDGSLSIPANTNLVVNLRGRQNSTFRLVWSRQTVTNIKETGNVQRAISQ